jgi:hypothetical protein
MRKILREPLVHFLLAGAALFLLFGAVGDRGSSVGVTGPESDRIVVSEGDFERLVTGWTKTWQRPPTREELDALIEDHIAEEIFYREALVMGLDQDDMIIRRRLRQKMEFLVEDLAGQTDPTDEQLQQFMQEDADRYRVGGLTSFVQVYINWDERGEAALEYAARLLEELAAAGDEVDLALAGDRLLMLPSEFESASERDVRSLFGMQFAERLPDVPVGQWTGPVESGYGLHLVLVHERSGGRTPSLEEVRDDVLRDWQLANREQTNREVYERFREKYDVVVERPEWAESDEMANAER